MMNHVVLPNGTLDDTKIIKREVLYTGMNGKKVERFFLTANDSYIFKPLTNQKQLGKEVWINDHILSVFPPIYPKIIAHSISIHSELNWIIFEDVGPLQHIFNTEIALNVTEKMVQWHLLPIKHYRNADLQPPKPPFEKIAAEVVLRKKEVLNVTGSYSLPDVMIETVYSLLKEAVFSQDLVLTHGDLHSGNYALINHKLIILDWEHAHINSPLWDLYHLIDVSHPQFPKTVTNEVREQVLDFYIEEMKARETNLIKDDFKREYYLFSAVFSIWMLLLIEADLKKGEQRWPIANLKAQLKETVNSLLQCIAQLRTETSFLKID